MIDFEVNQRAGKKISQRLWQAWFKKIDKVLKPPKSKGARVSVAVVGPAAIKKLNKQYRGKDKVTDVLSFSELDSPQKKGIDGQGYWGEVIICYNQAAKQAKEYGRALNEELEWLLVHGVLHLVGHDHQKPAEEKKMRALEEKIMGRPR